jgi:ribulose-5-phosphate 4-epimerase/fuculose-1-phosphate aldolase
VGRSVAEAFLAMYFFETSCSIQLRAQAGGGALIGIDPGIVATAREQAAAGTRGLGAQIAWPGLLRRLACHHPGWDR